MSRTSVQRKQTAEDARVRPGILPTRHRLRHRWGIARMKFRPVIAPAHRKARPRRLRYRGGHYA